MVLQWLSPMPGRVSPTSALDDLGLDGSGSAGSRRTSGQHEAIVGAHDRASASAPAGEQRALSPHSGVIGQGRSIYVGVHAGGAAGVAGAQSDHAPPKAKAKSKLSIFQTKGVWVRPSSVSGIIGPRRARYHHSAVEEHLGKVDESVGVDMGQAILAFEFIDRINDEMVQHYLPQIDSNLGKTLGLAHDPTRLADPDASLDNYTQSGASASDLAPGSPSAADGALADADGESNHFVRMADTVGLESPASRRGKIGVAGDLESTVLRKAGSAGSDTMHLLEAHCSDVASADDAMSTLTVEAGRGLHDASAGSLAQRHQVGVVDGSPSASPKSTSDPPVDDAHSSSESPKLDTSQPLPASGNWSSTSSDLAKMLGSIAIAQGRPKVPVIDPDDPASAAASLATTYGRGAARAVALGKHKALSARRSVTPGNRGAASRRTRPWQDFASPDIQTARGSPSEQEPSNSRSMSSAAGAWPSSARGVAAGVRPLPQVADRGWYRSTQGTPRGAGHIVPRPNTCPPGVDGGILVSADINRGRDGSGSPPPDGCDGAAIGAGALVLDVTLLPQAAGLGSRVASGQLSPEESLRVQASAVNAAEALAIRRLRERPPNETCPFSHEPMDATSPSIDLRCGHRFSLAHLSAARKAAERCSVAGFAEEDALICPLCGDQARTNIPGSRGLFKTLTTYSASTDAYMGDLRKDFQQPLRLPTQVGATSRSSGRTFGGGGFRGHGVGDVVSWP